MAARWDRHVLGVCVCPGHRHRSAAPGQVFNKCDLDGDGRVSKVDMVASVLFTGYLYDIEHNGVLNRQQVHDFAERVLGCPVEDELVDQIMSSYDLDGSGLINVHEMRRASHPGVIAEQVVV